MHDFATEHLLLVEGKDDEHVIEKLVKRHGLPQTFSIKEKGGFDELHASIYSEVVASECRVLGIVADANEHPNRRWRSIADRLNKAKCAVPLDLPVGGSVFSGPHGKRIGVWLMPDNQQPGELEDFVADMIPPGDTVWPRARQYIDGIPEGTRKFSSAKITRAYVHAWLSARKEPRPMGTAITAGDLRHNSSRAVSFVDWLRTLFELQAQ